MKRMITTVLSAAWLGCGLVAQTLPTASTTTPVTPATSQHAVLVELFTSEGCSDCPRAEEVFARMNLKHTPAGTTIIGLAEHVTYFNNAWEDPFSGEQFTDRQKSYVDRLGGEQFTPMVVVMGQSAMNGADGHSILKAVDATKNAAVTLKILSAKREGKKLKVEYSAQGLPKRGVAVVAFVVDDEDTVQIPRGENKNRTLHHAFVVRTVKPLEDVQDSGIHTSEFSVEPSKIPQHLVLVLQQPGVGQVLAAETMAFN